jgi:acyl-coenzyme A thioesterase PaaI-like protein
MVASDWIRADTPRGMSGLEFVKGLASGALPMKTIAQTLGYDAVEAESGRIAVTLNPTGAHLNRWGTVHGGLTATLLDSCMGLAIQSMLEKASTLEFKISLVRDQGRGQSPQLRPSSAWQKAA